MSYFSPQTRLESARYQSDGTLAAGVWVGDTGNVSIDLAVEVEEVIEHHTGNRGVAARIPKVRRVTWKAQLREMTLDNLRMFLHGAAPTATTGATATAQTLASGAAAGQTLFLPHVGVSDVVITDSGGTPKTLPAGQYTVNGPGGSITLLDITGGGAYVQPFKAAYSYASNSQVGLFTDTAIPERYLRMTTLNTAAGNAAQVWELYRVAIDPVASLPLVSDTIAELEISGTALMDASKPAGGALGQFGRVLVL